MNDYSYDLPSNYYFGGGGSSYGTTISVLAILLAAILILSLPKKYVIVPYLIAGLLIPLSVSFAIASLDFNANRLLLIAGLSRILMRREWEAIEVNSLDKIIVSSVLVNAICYVLLWHQIGTLINRAGFVFSSLGAYLFLRTFIRTKEDILRAIKVLLLVVIIIAPCMWSEHNTRHNKFSIVGAQELSNIRHDRIRAQGPFAHAIIAGTFGVVMVPLFVGLYWNQRKYWYLSSLGIAGSATIMIASSSSTPIMSLPAGLLALSMWAFRNKMSLMRRIFLVMLVITQLFMNHPIWFLIDRVSGILGGSGWHRAMLIDNFVRHFFDWFLIGTRDNPNWGWSMWDVDNAYVAAGLMGGLLGFILYIKIFVKAYQFLGESRRLAESGNWSENNQSNAHGDARLVWAIGSALFANSIAFFGIVYFDQSILAWYTLLSIISLTAELLLAKQKPVKAYL